MKSQVFHATQRQRLFRLTKRTMIFILITFLKRAPQGGSILMWLIYLSVSKFQLFLTLFNKIAKSQLGSVKLLDLSYYKHLFLRNATKTIITLNEMRALSFNRFIELPWHSDNTIIVTKLMLPSYHLSQMKEVSEHVRQNLTTENDVTWTLTKL